MQLKQQTLLALINLLILLVYKIDRLAVAVYRLLAQSMLRINRFNWVRSHDGHAELHHGGLLGLLLHSLRLTRQIKGEAVEDGG